MGFVMNTTELFEIFNHCATEKDPAQILEISNDLEIFSSDSFSDGKIYYGEDAPEAFRNAFKDLCAQAEKFSLRVKHRTGSAKSAAYVTDQRNGGKLSTSILQFQINKDNWVSFVQTSN